MSIRHLRRKPGNRCVILYELTLTHPRASQQQLQVCGKVYRTASKRAVNAALEALHRESEG